MTIKTFIFGTIAGGITIFVFGLLMFLLPPLAAFYTHAMNSGSAAGVARGTPILWATFLGALSYAALITLILGTARSVGVVVGLKAGALVGLLLWFTADLMLYATTNVGSMATTLAGPFVELIPGAFAGAVIAFMLERSVRESESMNRTRSSAAVAPHPRWFLG